jgi:thiol-disulfide isomerase/thioredoxin
MMEARDLSMLNVRTRTTIVALALVAGAAVQYRTVQASVPAGAAQPPEPQAQAATPAGCLQIATDFLNERVKSARAEGRMTSERYQAITRERAKVAAECVAKISLEKTPAADLVMLAEVYLLADQPERAKEAVAKALTVEGLGVPDRARILAAGVRLVLSQPISEARNAQAERYVAELDALPDTVIIDKIAAHGSLNSYYRADDIDGGIIAHSTKLIEMGRKLTPEQRKATGTTLIRAYANLAEALADREETAQALDLLRRAPKELAGLESVNEIIAPTLERYLLVGTAAAPIEAPRWLNAPAGTTKLDPKGAVRLIQFTAHWCGPCREAYPGIIRLSKRFADKGFQVTMVTQLYGYFGSQRNLSPADELAADETYFREHGITFPIAVADMPQEKAGTGTAAVNANEANYKVGGIPQIMIVDKRGRIRLIMVGYDNNNEERLAGLIGRLLGE